MYPLLYLPHHFRQDVEEDEPYVVVVEIAVAVVEEATLFTTASLGLRSRPL